MAASNQNDALWLHYEVARFQLTIRDAMGSVTAADQRNRHALERLTNYTEALCVTGKRPTEDLEQHIDALEAQSVDSAALRLQIAEQCLAQAEALMERLKSVS